MANRSKLSLIFLVLCAAACVDCSNGFVKNFAETGKLQQQLKDKYLEKEIKVSFRDGGFLTITFVDSPLNQKDKARRAARAGDVAGFVIKNFPSIGKVHGIWIFFMASERRWVVFPSARSVDSFAFNNRGDLFRQPDVTNIAADSEDPLSPNVTYNPARNETDISLTRIQLAGDLNRGGIALVPYFTVKGDARGPVKHAAPPSAVVFDFASYADQKAFSADAKLEILCDGKSDFSGKARLLLPKASGSEGSNAQFLTAEIPFYQFFRMAEARHVTVKLDNQQYQLSPEAIAALKRIAGYVVPPVDDGR